jgi:hypothetical protein
MDVKSKNHEWAKGQIRPALHKLVDQAVTLNSWKENQDFKVYFASPVPFLLKCLCLVCCAQGYDARSDEEMLFVWKNTDKKGNKYYWQRGDSTNGKWRQLLFLLMNHDTDGNQVTKKRIGLWLQSGLDSKDLVLLKSKFVQCNYNWTIFFA